MTSVDLNCVISGEPSGAPLLLGPSLGTTLSLWDPQLDALAHRRVVAFDHRGHGASPVPPGPYAIDDLGRDVVALLDRLEIDRADYAGVSLGGMVGIWLAANVPERIGKLVLISATAHFPPATAWTERADAVRAGGTAAVADAVVGRWLTPAFAAAHPELGIWLREMLLTTPADGYAACCEAIGAMDLRDDLEAIVAPALVIAGAEDPSTPPDRHTRPLAAGIDGARFELIPDAAHLPLVQHPGTVTRLLLDHLEDA